MLHMLFWPQKYGQLQDGSKMLDFSLLIDVQLKKPGNYGTQPLTIRLLIRLPIWMSWMQLFLSIRFTSIFLTCDKYVMLRIIVGQVTWKLWNFQLHI